MRFGTRFPKFRSTVAAAIVGAAALTATLVAAPAAYASTNSSCGNWANYAAVSIPARDSAGNLVANVRWWKVGNLGCAQLDAYGSYSGVAKYMRVYIANHSNNYMDDHGSYRYYAGPVGVPSSSFELCQANYYSGFQVLYAMNGPSGNVVVPTTYWDVPYC